LSAMNKSEQGTTGQAQSSAGASAGTDEAAEIAVDGYIYGYPLVLMEITRRLMTNFERPTAIAAGAGAPINQFVHMRVFPDAKFTDVVRPNADTLYSMTWLDVSREPQVIKLPESGGRYYLLPMLDMWTDVFASPGKRTSGTAERTLVIADADWHGDLPRDVELIRAPTSAAWVIGRTQTNGKADYDAVHAFQDGMSVVPLSALGSYYEAPAGKLEAGVSKVPPVEQVARMDAATYFATLANLLRVYRPHGNDYPMLERLARIGLVVGQPFDVAKLPPGIQKTLSGVPAAGQVAIKQFVERSAPIVNGWLMLRNPVGTYGTAYLDRAMVAHLGLGANTLEDACYPTLLSDGDGKPLSSNERYVVHFERQQIPPVRGFWSMTMYNDKQFFADNPIGRYAIGDRDDLKFNGDGSLDIYIQRQPPGGDRDRNWLPAPASGGFSMNLRLYWPKAEVLDARWNPPAVKRVAG
jgi:hypothetical protein